VKLKNETKYSGRELRSLFTAVYRRMEKTEGPHPGWMRGYSIRVRYSRRSGRVSGNAWIKGNSQNLFLPRGRVSVETLATVFEHEMFHSYGYRHNAIGARFTWSESNRASFAWAVERFGRSLGEREPEAKAKPKGPVLQEHRYSLVKAGIERWEKRKKAAETRLKTLRRKARYYERALAATRGGDA